MGLTFVAEIGSNWIGKVPPKDLIEMAVSEAKQAGADAVKFQYFTHGGLYSAGRAPELRERAKLLELGEENLKIAAKCAATHELDLWVSVFDPMDVRTVARYADVIKIASGDLTYNMLLIDADDCGKPLALSTGGALDYEIADALEMLEKEPILFYCISEYPALPDSFRLGSILRYKAQAKEIGLSDHTQSAYVAGLAAAMGYTVFEKHFKSYYTSPESPDYGVSADPQEFKEYVAYVKRAAKIAGGTKKYITVEENAERIWARRGDDGLRPTNEIKAVGGFVTGVLPTLKAVSGGGFELDSRGFSSDADGMITYTAPKHSETNEEDKG